MCAIGFAGDSKARKNYERRDGALFPLLDWVYRMACNGVGLNVKRGIALTSGSVATRIRSAYKNSLQARTADHVKQAVFLEGLREHRRPELKFRNKPLRTNHKARVAESGKS